MVGILHMESEVNKKFIETMKKKIFKNECYQRINMREREHY
jgi:hypothetical protein